MRNGTDEQSGLPPVGRWGVHATCGTASLLAAVAVLVFAYSALVAATRLLSVLSSTAIVVLGAATWLVVWVALEVAVDRLRRTGGRAD